MQLTDHVLSFGSGRGKLFFWDLRAGGFVPTGERSWGLLCTCFWLRSGWPATCRFVRRASAFRAGTYRQAALCPPLGLYLAGRGNIALLCPSVLLCQS